ncbi:MAG: hypothetical protein ACXWUK_12305 [Burkholderiales bacterium]
MLITDALGLAKNEHVVLFLLTAYVDTLHHYEENRSALHPQVTSLPLTGRADVAARLRVLRDTQKWDDSNAPTVPPLLQEAIDVFVAASRRLNILAQARRPRRAAAVWAGELPAFEQPLTEADRLGERFPGALIAAAGRSAAGSTPVAFLLAE